MNFWLSGVSIQSLSDLFAVQPSLVPCGPDFAYCLIHFYASPSCRESCSDKNMFSLILMVFSESFVVTGSGLLASSPQPLKPNTVFLCFS